MDMFEKASRMKLRFASSVGLLSTEDLWDLPLIGKGPNLDDVARLLYNKLKKSDTKSFVLKEVKPNDADQLRFDIVKHVIDVRLVEQEKAEQARLIKEKKQKIVAIMAEKEDQHLKESSLDELRTMLEEL